MLARGRAGALAIGGYGLASAVFLVVAGSAGSTVLVPSIVDAAGPFDDIGTAFGVSTLSTTSRVTLQVAASILLTVAFAVIAACAWRRVVSARSIIALAVIVNIAVVFAPILFSRDVYSYATYARIVVVHAENPYVVTPARFPDDPFAEVIGDVWRDEPSVYGPAFTWLTALMVVLTHDPGLEIVFLRLLASGAALATLLLVRRMSDSVSPDRTAFALAVAGLTPVLPFLTVVGGHNDPIVALASVGGTWLLAGDRAVRGLITWTLGTLVKLTGGIALVVGAAGWLGAAPRKHRLRRGLVAAAVAIATTLVVSLPFLQRDDPLLAQTRLANREGWISPGRALRDLATRIVESLVPSAATEARHVAHVLLLVSLAAAVAWVARCAYRRASLHGWRLQDVGAAIGVATLAALLLAPASPPWYMVWVLPFVWLMRPAQRWAALILATIQFLSLPVADAELFPSAFRTTARIADGVLSPVAIILLVVVLRDAITTRHDLADPALAAEQPE